MIPEIVGALWKLHEGPAAAVQVTFDRRIKNRKFHATLSIFKSEGMPSIES
jgi:hypothetical protein